MAWTSEVYLISLFYILLTLIFLLCFSQYIYELMGNNPNSVKFVHTDVAFYLTIMLTVMGAILIVMFISSMIIDKGIIFETIERKYSNITSRKIIYILSFIYIVFITAYFSLSIWFTNSVQNFIYLSYNLTKSMFIISIVASLAALIILFLPITITNKKNEHNKKI